MNTDKFMIIQIEHKTDVQKAFALILAIRRNLIALSFFLILALRTFLINQMPIALRF